MLLGGDGGVSGRGDLKEVSFMFVLLGGGKYCMIALFLIRIFDFYMILCSRQLMYLKYVSVVTLSFDWRNPILHKADLSAC